MAIHCVCKEGGYVVKRWDLTAQTLEEALREVGRVSEFELWEGSRRLYTFPCDAANEGTPAPGWGRR